MTSYEVIFNAFLSKIQEDSWCNEEIDLSAIVADWESILESALPWFKFPRKSLNRVPSEIDDYGNITYGYFTDDLGSQEIQIIANLMKWQWLDRTIHSWENVRAMYDERDFSQANLLNNFVKLLSKTEEENYHLQKLYSRSREDENGNRSSWEFGSLAGRNYGQ